MVETKQDRELASRAVNPSEHATFFSSAILRLGEIHWRIVRAADLMDAKAYVKKKVREGLSFITQESTDFGKEVGRDEINWWVFRKENDIHALREMTQRAVEAAQILKEASAVLRKSKAAGSYSELLNALRSFAEERGREIEILYDYVMWLGSRDPMAPAILFTYRVWGSTRRGDRWPDIDASAQAPDTDAIRHCSAIVLGLTSRGLATLDQAHYEIGAEIWERIADEETARDVEIPMGRVVARASRIAYDACAVYFEEIRDSLRNILIDVDKFVVQRDLVSSDGFWRAVVEKAIAVKSAEPQLWDFKKTLPMWHIGNGPDRELKKIEFAEDVASFANARGGVLIVGINDQREVVGIGSTREVESRLKFASEVLQKHMEYDRPIFRFHQLELAGGDAQERICLLVIVGQACGVVGVRDEHGRYTYPVRRETGLRRETRDALLTPKLHMKSDNHDFLAELEQFAREGIA